MSLIKIGSFLSAVMIGLATALFSLGALGMMAPALAQEPELEIYVPAAQPSPWDIYAFVVFTDPAVTEIQDLEAVVRGNGTHLGNLRCNNNCSQKTELQLDGVAYEYQFKTRQVVDPDERRIVVAGTGTKSSNGKRDRFLFTAAFEDNRDGMIRVRYEASRQDASFIVPGSAGTMIFRQR